MGKKTREKKALPKGWREVRLNEVGTFSKGNGITKNELVEDGAPCVRYGEIYTRHNFRIRKFYSFISNKDLERRKLIKRNSLLFAGSGETRDEIGKCISFDCDLKAYAGGDVIICSINPQKLRADFASYYLNTVGRKQINKLGQGDSIVHIYSRFLGNVEILLPTISEQKAIASLLETWDTAIEKTETLIVAKEKRFKWLLKTLISDQWNNPEWRKVKLEDVGLISSAGVDKKIVEGEKPVRLVNYLDVLRKDFILSDDLNHWVTAPERKTAQCNVRKGDIFFTPSSEIQGDIAHSAVSLDDMGKAVYSYHIVRFRLKENWDLLFRGYAFKASGFYRQAYRLCDGSGQRYVISQGNFRKMTICVPDINEQKRIAGILSTAQREIDSLKQLVKFYRLQKRGLMQKLLIGSQT